jgi:hypothetical protein
MDNNAIFRRRPLNYNQFPNAMTFHKNGVLSGIRPTPPQFAPQQTQPNMEDKVNTRKEFWRVPLKENVGKTKFIAPSDSSTLTSARKRVAVGRSSYYSTSGDFSTKNYNINVAKQAVQRLRSSGSVAPKKKGAN